MVIVNAESEGVCMSHWQTPALLREEQQDWAVCDPIYMTAVGVDVVPAKVPCAGLRGWLH